MSTSGAHFKQTAPNTVTLARVVVQLPLKVGDMSGDDVELGVEELRCQGTTRRNEDIGFRET